MRDPKPTPAVIALAAAILASLALVAATPAMAQREGRETVRATPSPLQPGDKVRVFLWQEPDLSGEYLIDETGVVSLPILGARQVTRRPARQVKRQLEAEYDRQLRNQPAQITFLRRVRILGEVGQPGLYHVDATMTLGDAIALAGGVTPNGDADDIRILREGSRIRARLDQGAGMGAVESGDEILVPRRSWIERNATFLIGTILTTSAILITR